MKRLIIWVVAVCLLFVLETSLLPPLSLNGNSPDLLLLFLVSLAFLRGPNVGVFAGFCLGSLSDIATGTFFGITILAKMVVAFTGGALSDRVFKEHTILPLFYAAWATALHFFIVYALAYLLGYAPDFAWKISSVLIPSLIYNLLFALPVYRLVAYLSENFWPERQTGASQFGVKLSE